MSDPDWNRMKDLVLQRLRAKYNAMSESLRNLPTIHFQDPNTMESILLSPNDVIREVSALSELGKKVVSAEITKLQKMQP